MPPTTLVPTYRVVFRYTVDSFTHKNVCYLLANASADPSGFDTVPRSGFAATGVSNIADAFWNAIKAMYDPANCTFDSMTLENQFLGAWIPLYTKVTAVAPTATTGNAKAIGLDVVGKDLNHRTQHFYLYEPALLDVSRVTAVSSFSARLATLADYVLNTGGTANYSAAWAWRVARGGIYAKQFLSIVIDSNQKLRRLRRIA